MLALRAHAGRKGSNAVALSSYALAPLHRNPTALPATAPAPGRGPPPSAWPAPLASAPVPVRCLHCSHPRRHSDTPLASTKGPNKTPASLAREVAVPREARIVIIGGGVIGCSVAYHLAKAGAKKVVLLEKSQLTHGCTWHAAGLLGTLRGTKNLTRMLQYSAECFGSLLADTGVDPEWRPVGSLRVASSMERWKEIKRSSSQAASFGFDMHLVSPAEAARLCPVLRTEDLIGAAWIPSDGHVEPTSLTNAFARGARDRGVEIIQGAEVVGVEHAPADGSLFARGRVKSLRVRVKGDTDSGKTHSIAVEKVINCAGLWARPVGQLLGTAIPTVNVEHQYAVTEPLKGHGGLETLPANLPSFRDPDALLYYKPEQGGLVVGGWESNTVARVVPSDFGPELYEGNMDRFEQHALQAAHRTPVLEHAGIRKLVNGPIPISPDGEPIMGLCDELSNVFVAAGFTAGIGASGGAGKYLAEWVLAGEPSMDLWPLDIRRFATGGPQQTRAWLDMRGVEAYGSYYQLHYPGKEAQSGRGARRSGAFELTRKLEAVFGQKMGWERPLYYAVDESGIPLEGHAMSPSFNRRQGDSSHAEWDCVAREHRAAREGVMLVDQSSFAKLLVSGPGAAKFLNRLANNDLTGPPGSVVYTQMLNERGGIEADVTIARLSETELYVITGAGFATRDFGWIRSQLPSGPSSPDDGDIVLQDVTTQFGVLNVAGPNSRLLLESLGVEEDISHAAFPFMTWRALQLSCGLTVRAMRVTFVGELGFELHVPMESLSLLYEALWSTAQRHPELGARNGGYRALESLRLEKGYRVWGSDLSPRTNPLEVGLGFCCKFGKAGGFIGEEALKEIKAAGVPKRKMVCFTVDDASLLSNAALGFASPDPSVDAGLHIRPSDPLFLYGNEAISYRDRGVVGHSTSAGFGYTLGQHILYAFLPAELADAKQPEGAGEAGVDGQFTVNAYGTQVALRRHPLNRALYDPKREKILR